MRRPGIRIWVAVLCLLATGMRLACAYYDDTHYSFNYYMARACGYTPEQARRTASACVRIDYSAETEPNQYGNVFNPLAASGSARGSGSMLL